MEADLKKLQNRIEALQKKTHRYDIVIAVIAAIAVIFGISGAWGYKAISASQEQISELENSIASTEARVTALGDSVSEYEATFASLLNEAKAQLKDSASDLELDLSKKLIAKLEAATANATDSFNQRVKDIEDQLPDMHAAIGHHENQISVLHDATANVVRFDIPYHIQGTEGFLLSNNSQNQNPVDLLITPQPTEKTKWKIRP